MTHNNAFVRVIGAALLILALHPASTNAQGLSCPVSHSQLETTLKAVVAAGGNGGLSNNMWATVVDRDGVVCAVARSSDRGNQWPGSRINSAQKAFTANAFSLPKGAGGAEIALSSGNLYGTALEGGPLFGVQFSNPVDASRAYTGNPARFGTNGDPLVGSYIGGINIFGGGLALYQSENDLVGGLGVSGDLPCTDHIVAWKVRDALGLDNVNGGVSATGDDNLKINTPVGAGTFEHPSCGANTPGLIADLPLFFPIGPNN